MDSMSLSLLFLEDGSLFLGKLLVIMNFILREQKLVIIQLVSGSTA